MRSSGRGARVRRPPRRRYRPRGRCGSRAARRRARPRRAAPAGAPPSRLNGQSTSPSIVLASAGVQPLADVLVVDLTRYLPGAFASRELLRLGARVVRLEAPGGDPMRALAPAWDEALNARKESVVCDLKRDGAF